MKNHLWKIPAQMHRKIHCSNKEITKTLNIWPFQDKHGALHTDYIQNETWHCFSTLRFHFSVLFLLKAPHTFTWHYDVKQEGMECFSSITRISIRLFQLRKLFIFTRKFQVFFFWQYQVQFRKIPSCSRVTSDQLRGTHKLFLTRIKTFVCQ